jgi:hypothetical protein
VKSWVRHCHEHHGSDCEPEPVASLQKLRLVDYLSKIVVSAPLDCQFVALSYVWGGDLAGDVGAQLMNLPLTIEDALTMTKILGYRYLWVDRYVC